MTFLVLATALGAACGTPCGDLKSRAAHCGTASGPYIDERHSVCTATRNALGKESFDSFAGCVTDAACSDAQAIDRCSSAALNGDPTPCTWFELWASACGLEPPGTADDCQSMVSGMGDLVFERWVLCITADGCPQPDDARYDRCQEEILPHTTAQVIDACVLLNAWNQACADVSPDVGAVGGGDLAACVSAAAPFTADSYLAYAQCLSEVACDDLAGRLNCLFQLGFSDPTTATPACQRLVDFAAGCGTALGGGSVDACVRLYARFTEESLDAYVTCIEGLPCNDTTGQLGCIALLRLQ